jgi:4-amino-4-deoxy-L-arabinose transferase-like glycosyltransferase
VITATLALLAAFWAARLVNPSELDDRFDHMEAWLRRFGPVAAAVVSILVIWWTWGALNPLAIVHDESSYVLQSEIFARFRWTAPSPAIPEFFEQPHVLVVPAVASKYPPGHALLMAIGSLLHFPALMPLLLTGATAALIMMVTTRVTNPWMGLLAWIIWLTTPLVLRYQPGYFSETTTTALVLASWWCLLEWRETRKRSWIALLGLAVGWGAITRPLTMLAFGIPIAAIVISDVIRYRFWLEAPIALGGCLAVLAIVPLWSARTTGDRALTPTALYTRDYLPFDKPGFTPDTTPPRRAQSPVVKSLYDDFLAHHQRQRLGDLHRTFGERAWNVARDLWRGTQLVLLPFFLIGLFSMPRELRFGAASAALAFLAHLGYAHDAPWTLYYAEMVPVVAAITACGAWRALVRVARGVVIQRHIDRRPKLGAALVALVLAFSSIPTFVSWRRQHEEMTSVRTAFEQAMTQLPASKAIIFLRYAQRPHHLSLVFNSADLQHAPVWVVHDLGDRNQELVKLALDRTAFVFDETAMEFRRF